MSAPLSDGGVVDCAQDWMSSASCSGFYEAFFSDDTTLAKTICATCPVQGECLSFALDRPHIVGVWGGTDDVERRRIRHRLRLAVIAPWRTVESQGVEVDSS